MTRIQSAEPTRTRLPHENVPKPAKDTTTTTTTTQDTNAATAAAPTTTTAQAPAAPATPATATPATSTATAATTTTTASEETQRASRARFAADPRAAQLAHGLQSQVPSSSTSSAPTALTQRTAETHAHGPHAGDSASGVGTAGGARPASSTFASRADAVSALERDYGVRVRDGSATWTTEELSRAHEAFARMPAAERARLSGLDLVREHEAPASVREEHHGSGEVAGLYSPNVEAREGTGERVRPGSITMYDAAFPPGDAEASRRTSIHVALHEAGHAVEGRRRDDAMAASNGTAMRANAASDGLNDAMSRSDPARVSANDAITALNDAPAGDTRADVAAYNRVQRTQDAVGAATARVAAATSDRELSSARTALDRAVTARDAALADMPAGHPARAAAEDLARAQDAWGTTARDEGAARVAYTRASSEHTTAERALGRLQNDSQTSTTLQRFEEFRASRAGAAEGPVSDYGATEPAEDFAEAYGLFRRDPEYMREHYPRTYEWFNNPRNLR